MLENERVLEQEKEGFEVGDIVRWNEEHISDSVVMDLIEKYGNGSFEVVAVDGETIRRLHTENPKTDSLDEAINKAHPQILTIKVTNRENGSETTMEINGDWIEKIN